MYSAKQSIRWEIPLISMPDQGKPQKFGKALLLGNI